MTPLQWAGIILLFPFLIPVLILLFCWHIARAVLLHSLVLAGTDVLRSGPSGPQRGSRVGVTCRRHAAQASDGQMHRRLATPGWGWGPPTRVHETNDPKVRLPGVPTGTRAGRRRRRA